MAVDGDVVEIGAPARRTTTPARKLFEVDDDFHTWLKHNQALSAKQALHPDEDFYNFKIHFEIMGDFVFRDLIKDHGAVTVARAVKQCAAAGPHGHHHLGAASSSGPLSPSASIASGLSPVSRTLLSRVCEKLSQIRGEFLLGFFKFIYSEAYEVVKQHLHLQLTLPTKPTVTFDFVSKYEKYVSKSHTKSKRPPFFAKSRLILEMAFDFPKSGYDFHSKHGGGLAASGLGLATSGLLSSTTTLAAPTGVGYGGLPLAQHVFRRFCSLYEKDKDDALGVFFIRAVEFAGADMLVFEPENAALAEDGEDEDFVDAAATSGPSSASATASAKITPSRLSSFSTRRVVRQRFYLQAELQEIGDSSAPVVVETWSHGTGLIITPQKSHRFSYIFRTCHAHARSPCCIHGRNALYHTQTYTTIDEKW